VANRKIFPPQVFWGQETRMVGYWAEKEVWRYLQSCGYNTPTWQTDRRTPGDSKDRAYALCRAL